jgi:golgi to ER traffic protein 4
MIIVQVILNLLILNDKTTAVETFEFFVRHHPQIRTKLPPYKTPLLNFTYFLLNIIDEKKLQAFTTLCDLYKTALSRDPAYEKQLEKIGLSYFNAPVKKQNVKSNGLFGDFFSQLFQELENDSDDDDDLSQRPTSSLKVSNNDLD